MRTTTHEVTATSRPPEGVIIKPYNPDYLEQIWKDALSIQKDCVDVTIEDVGKSLLFTYFSTQQGVAKGLMYNSDKIVTYGKYVDEDYLGQTKSAYLTSHSFGQLCTKLGIPIRYMDKCEKAGQHDLVVSNLNSWLKEDNREMLLRLYNNEVRGILGSRYSTLDAPDILQVVAQNTFLRGSKVKGYVLDPTRLHLRLVSNEPFNVDGEDLFPGVVIDSSDVGKSSLRVQFFIYKQICTNGLMLPTNHSMLFVQKHIGITLDEFVRGLKDGLSICPNLASEAEGLLKTVTTAKSLTTSVRQDLLLKGPDKHLFSEDTTKEILDLQDDRYSTNQWGLINAITDYAQRFSLERRLMFEEAAGRLLFQKI